MTHIKTWLFLTTCYIKINNKPKTKVYEHPVSRAGKDGLSFLK